MVPGEKTNLAFIWLLGSLIFGLGEIYLAWMLELILPQDIWYLGLGILLYLFAGAGIYLTLTLLGRLLAKAAARSNPFYVPACHQALFFGLIFLLYLSVRAYDRFLYNPKLPFLLLLLFLAACGICALSYRIQQSRPFSWSGFAALVFGLTIFLILASHLNLEVPVDFLSWSNLLHNAIVLAVSALIYLSTRYLLHFGQRRPTLALILGGLWLAIFGWGVHTLLVPAKAPPLAQEKLLIRTRPEQHLPNIILISIDSLRPDYLSCYGQSPISTRNIDRLAQKSVLFRRAYAQSSWTMPSMASILTMLYPTAHGATELALAAKASKFYSVAESAIWIQQLLQSLGYRTQAYVNNPAVDRIFGFARGFDDYANFRKSWVRPEEKDSALWRAIKYLLTPKDISLAEAQTEAVLAWLAARPAQPFFLWLFYLDPHIPYERKKRYFSFQGYQGGLLDSQGNFISPPPDYPFTAADKTLIRRLYMEEILSVDENIGRLMRYLERLGLTEDTLLIITADHGEEFWEHHPLFATHGHSMYNELLHVPLIFWSRTRLPHGKVINTQVRCIDIMPTVLDLLGVKPRFPVQGRSLLPVIYGRETKDREVFSEWTYRGQEIKALNRGDYKLIKYYGEKRVELYQLESDPQEVRDLAKLKPQIAAELEKKLVYYITESEGLAARFGRKLERKRISLPAAVRERLKSLGYTQ